MNVPLRSNSQSHTSHACIKLNFKSFLRIHSTQDFNRSFQCDLNPPPKANLCLFSKTKIRISSPKQTDQLRNLQSRTYAFNFCVMNEPSSKIINLAYQLQCSYTISYQKKKSRKKIFFFSFRSKTTAPAVASAERGKRQRLFLFLEKITAGFYEITMKM